MKKCQSILVALFTLSFIAGYSTSDDSNGNSTTTVTDTSGSQSGPWNDRVFSATSPDGLNWTKDPNILFNTASVPGAVKGTNGTIFLYTVYLPGPTTNETLMVAISTDGQNFSVRQPINVPNSVITRRVDPNPVLLPDGRIRLYYIDFGTIPTKNLYSAISNDGINFTEEPGIRFTQNHITDPDVFYLGGNWVGFLSKPNVGMQIIRIVSSDGLNFIEDATFNWNNGGISFTFLFPGNIYRTYYCAMGGMKSAMSTDGYNLTVEPSTRIQPGMNEVLCDPTIVQLASNSYVMYYKTFLVGK